MRVLVILSEFDDTQRIIVIEDCDPGLMKKLELIALDQFHGDNEDECVELLNELFYKGDEFQFEDCVIDTPIENTYFNLVVALCIN